MEGKVMTFQKNQCSLSRVPYDPQAAGDVFGEVESTAWRFLHDIPKSLCIMGWE